MMAHTGVCAAARTCWGREPQGGAAVAYPWVCRDSAVPGVHMVPGEGAATSQAGALQRCLRFMEGLVMLNMFC